MEEPTTVAAHGPSNNVHVGASQQENSHRIVLAKPGNTAEDLLHPQFTCPPTISAFRNRSTLPPQRAVSTASFARAVMKTQLTSLTTSYKRCHSHAWHAHAQNASDYPYRPPQSRLVHKSRISYTCSSLSSSDRLPHLNTVSVYRSMGGGGMWYHTVTRQHVTITCGRLFARIDLDDITSVVQRQAT